MRNLLVLLLAAATSGAVFFPKAEWSEVESLVPSVYFKTILNTADLYNDPSFLHKVIGIALKNLRLFVQTLYARQNYLNSYVACACPNGNVKAEILPPKWGYKVKLESPVEDLVKIQQEGSIYSKKMSEVVKLVTLECPMVTHCINKYSDTFMDILTGRQDSLILESVWQQYLPQFYPKFFQPLNTYDVTLPFQKAWSKFLKMFSVPVGFFNSPMYGYNYDYQPYLAVDKTFDVNTPYYYYNMYNSLPFGFNYKYKPFVNSYGNFFSGSHYPYFNNYFDYTPFGSNYNLYNMKEFGNGYHAFNGFEDYDTLTGYKGFGDYNRFNDFESLNNFNVLEGFKGFNKYPFEYVPFVYDGNNGDHKDGTYKFGGIDGSYHALTYGGHGKPSETVVTTTFEGPSSTGGFVSKVSKDLGDGIVSSSSSSFATAGPTVVHTPIVTPHVIIEKQDAIPHLNDPLVHHLFTRSAATSTAANPSESATTSKSASTTTST